MIKNLPSRKYTTFLELFEKKVDEYQKEINRLNLIEPIYNLVKQRTDLYGGNEEIKIDILSNLIWIDFRATPESKYSEIKKYVKSIGKELKADSLHNDGIPSCSVNSRKLACRWNIKKIGRMRDSATFMPSIYLDILLPAKGIQGIDVSEKFVTRTYTDVEYSVNCHGGLPNEGWHNADRGSDTDHLSF